MGFWRWLGFGANKEEDSGPKHMSVVSFTTEEANKVSDAMGEMYFDCPRCGHCERINNLGKMALQRSPTIFRNTKCVKCGEVFDAAPRAKFGECPKN